MRLFAEIKKIDHEQRLVFGYASTEALDSQGEIVRKEAIEAALPDYMRFANIREMHQPSAVGVAKEAEIDDKGLHLAARIVDDEAWKKVTEGVYKGFSIGGKVTARDAAAKHVITGVELLEISLVDRPANPEAVIELYKAAVGSDAMASKSTGGEVVGSRMNEPSNAASGAGTSQRPMSKGMDAVRDLAGILADIRELQESSASEEAAEGDDSAMPAKLKAWLDEGAGLLRDMVAEETGEISAAYDSYPVVSTVGKVGARHSKVDLARVQSVHDTAVDLGADCYGWAKTAAGEMGKLDAAIRQVVDPLTKGIADLRQRVAAIEGQPLPAKGVTKAIAVAKEQDAGGAASVGETLEAFVARLAGMTAEKRAHELTKLALRFPQPLR